MTPPKNWLLFPPKIRSAHLQALHDENDDSWSWYYVFLLNILYIYILLYKQTKNKTLVYYNTIYKKKNSPKNMFSL